MSETTYEAANVEAALAQAAESMGASADDLQYEIVEEKTDFWGGDEGTVVIKVWRAEDVAEAQAEAEQEPEAPAEVATPEVEAEPEGESEPEPEVAAEDIDGEDTETGGAFWDDGDDAISEEEADEPQPEAHEDAAGAAPEEPQAEADAPAAPAPAADATAAPEGEEVESESVVALLRQIFHDMDFDCEIEIEKQEGGFFAAVSGADKELLLEGNGRCLSALELVLNNAFRHKLPSGQKVHVDAGDFRSRREEELTDLAFQVAHSAKEAGKTQETQPLNPYERRLVHLALAEDSGVTTRSRGSGFLKNVQVIPSRSNGGDRRR